MSLSSLYLATSGYLSSLLTLITEGLIQLGILDEKVRRENTGGKPGKPIRSKKRKQETKYQTIYDNLQKEVKNDDDEAIILLLS